MNPLSVSQNTLGKTKMVANLDSSIFKMVGLQTLYQTASFWENEPLFSSQKGKILWEKQKNVANLDFSTFRMLGNQPLYKTATFWENNKLSASQRGKILWEKLKLLQILIPAQ